MNPLCEGMFLTLFEPACEVSDATFAETIGPDPGVVVQEAKVTGLAGGNGPRTVEFSLTNKSVRPVLVAQRFDDRSLGKSFSVMAETIGGQGIYELGPPRVNGGGADAGAPGDAGGPGAAHLHSTRIKLLPGGRAIALLVIDFKPTERLDKPRTDGGVRDAGGGDAGALATLEGSFNVHLGQLFSPAETGNPAKLQISNGIIK